MSPNATLRFILFADRVRRQAATARKAFEAVAMDTTAPHIAIAAALEEFAQPPIRGHFTR